MLLVYFLLSLFYLNCKSENIFSYKDELKDPSLISCITSIIKKHFSEKETLSYVDMKTEDNEILKSIHSSMVTAVIHRHASIQSHFGHQGYFIIAENATKLTDKFKYLLKEPTWNPLAHFLIVINSLKEDELRKIFDELFKCFVLNVIVVNGTKSAEIYTYNPYENYACGRYYDKVISYGFCSETKHNLYPNKLVTGLRNCTFLVSVGDRPPYSIFPWKSSDKKLGTEQYLFEILAEIEQFNIKVNYDYDKSKFSIISENMQVIGPMAKLQKNETDVMFGGTLLTSGRTAAFTYLHGHLDYEDELRFLVKRAGFKAIWKSAYLEFHPFVWCLLLIVFLIYQIIMMLLLRVEKTEIMLKLLNSLLLHGFKMPDRMIVKFFFITWVWFAYLMNSIYQSSLVSLTTNPILEHQVASEIDLVAHNMKPCITPGWLDYMYSEAKIYSPTKYQCQDILEVIKLVARSEDIYTLVPQSTYRYYKKIVNDKYGRSPVFFFKRPYAKVIFGFYFRKGFPISDRMRRNAIRLRETGFVDKSLKEIYFGRKLHYHFHKKEFESRFVLPWCLFTIGCVLSTAVFIFELLFARFKKYFSCADYCVM